MLSWSEPHSFPKDSTLLAVESKLAFCCQNLIDGNVFSLLIFTKLSMPVCEGCNASKSVVTG